MAAISSSNAIATGATVHHPVPSFSASSSTSSSSTSSAAGDFECIRKIWENASKDSTWETEFDNFQKHFAEISVTFTHPVPPPSVISETEKWRIPATPVDVKFQIEKLCNKFRENTRCPASVSKKALEIMQKFPSEIEENIKTTFGSTKWKLEKMNELLNGSSVDKKRDTFIAIARFFATAVSQEEVDAASKENPPRWLLSYDHLLGCLSDLTATLKYPH